MKQLIVCTGLIVFGLLAALLATRLSSDAIGMAVGLVFGLLAGVPTLLLLVAQRRERGGCDGYDSYRDRRPQLPAPPVVETHYHYHAAPGAWQPPTVQARLVAGVRVETWEAHP